MKFEIQEHASALQAARGISALAVTAGHCFTTIIYGRIEEPTFRISGGNAVLAVGELVLQPNTAVIFFYVLSGFVLGESLRRRPEFKAFAIRRLLRLLPMMWLSIAVALLAIAFLPLPPLPGATPWFNAFLGQPISTVAIVSDLAGLSWNVNSVLWSVQIELAMIPLFPLLMHVGARLRPRANLAFCGVLALISTLLWGKLPAAANAVLYLYCFHLGIILPRLYGDRRSHALLANGPATAGALLALLIIELMFLTHRLWMPYKYVADALISTMILGYIVTRPRSAAVAWLAARPLVWLGDVSYGFYVYSLSFQLVIAAAVLSSLQAPPTDAMATMLTIVITLATVVAALACAAVSRRWIELPGIALGQKWSQAISPAALPDASLVRRSA